MTEAEWLAGTDPDAMYTLIRKQATGRKLRLYKVACARLVWDRLTGVMREAVEAAERCADGVPRDDELRHHCERLYGMPVATGHPGQLSAEFAVYYLALKTTGSVDGLRHLHFGAGGPWVLALVGPHLPGLLREVFAAFRPTGDDAAWRTAIVTDFAESIYAGRAFDHLPELAAALESAGCDDADLLSHCRGAGPHARGCWALDAVLGRDG